MWSQLCLHCQPVRRRLSRILLGHWLYLFLSTWPVIFLAIFRVWFVIVIVYVYVCVLQMAKAGFFHIPSTVEPDLVRCFVCQKELDGWDPTDDPWYVWWAPIYAMVSMLISGYSITCTSLKYLYLTFLLSLPLADFQHCHTQLPLPGSPGSSAF